MATIGERNCLCRLMAPASGEVDGRGHRPTTGEQVGKFWCSIKQTSASEQVAFSQLYPTATHVLVAPYSRSVKPNPSMWFEYDGRKFEIVGVENIEERNREWRFLCSEKVAVRDGDV